MINKFTNFFKKPYFGFIKGHTELSENQIIKISNLIGKENNEITNDYENSFAEIIGGGKAVSFAAARMGFYVLMKTLGIGSADEVIIQGSTCSVMVNSIIRIGAKPIFADIDPVTFGSSAKEIEKVISKKTKIIVAQHSFGIPCQIQPIKELAIKKNIFLLEDCSLTLGSSIDGKVCGNFGDASIFSTDHTKPINTLLGGLVYTNNIKLYEKLKIIQTQIPSLSNEKQQSVFKQIIFEKKYCNPEQYGKFSIANSIKNRIAYKTSPFLDEDFGTKSSLNYDYPLKFPLFLSNLGLIELKKWKVTTKIRQNLLSSFLNTILKNKKEDDFVAYFDKSKEIIPLRLAWAPEDGIKTRKKLSHFLETSFIWFTEPIVATTEPLSNYGYIQGSCPIAEDIGPNMVNIPCNLDSKWEKYLVEKLKTI